MVRSSHQILTHYCRGGNNNGRFPKSSPYVVVGAGIHGLSTAYHLAKELDARGLGSGADIVVLEKSRAGRGRLRHRLRRRPQQLLPAGDERAHAGLRGGLGVRPGGVRTTTPSATWRSARPCRSSDLAETFERQERIGYRSTLITGEAEVDRHMKELFPDWRAQGVTAACTSTRAASRSTRTRSTGLAGKAAPRASRSSPASRSPASSSGRTTRCARSRRTRARSRSASSSSSRRARGRSTSGGCSACPMEIDVRTPSGDVVKDQPMWTYWNLQEGEITVDPTHVRAADGERTAGHPPRHGRAARTRTTASSSPTSSGGSTSSATATASRAAHRRSSSTATSSSIPIRRPPTSIPASPTCGARRSRMR